MARERPQSFATCLRTRSAKALAIRIVDAESAATYDRHSDGGEFLELHLVARVQRNEQLGIDWVEIRGEQLDGDGR